MPQTLESFRLQAARHSLAVVSIIASLSACAEVTAVDSSGTREFRGRFVQAWETSRFVPCGQPDSTLRWWASFERSASTAYTDSAFRAARDTAKNPYYWTNVLLEVRATLSGPGRFGHVQSYSREITIHDVRRITRWTANACDTP